MVVLNNRDRPKNIWLLTKLIYINNGIKVRIRKIYLNALTTTLTMLYLHSNKPNAATFVH